jgi:AcrR family transcriptional regulator
MQDVAEDAGVHRATVHRHFATRDDLVRAVRERALDDFAGLQGDPALQQMPPGAALEQLTRATLELGDRNRIYRVTAAFDDATDARGEELVTPLAALIERAQQAGSVRIDLPSRTLASAWAGLVLVALPQVAGAMSYDEGVSFVLALLRR